MVPDIRAFELGITCDTKSKYLFKTVNLLLCSIFTELWRQNRVHIATLYTKYSNKTYTTLVNHNVAVFLNQHINFFIARIVKELCKHIMQSVK